MFATPVPRPAPRRWRRLGPLLAVAATATAVGALVPAPAPAAATTAVLSGSTNGLVAFSDDRDGNREIYAVRADGSGLTRLTNDPAADRQPRWSPDGSKIAYLRDSQLWVMDADGTDAREVTGGADDSQLSWSPDGARIAYARNGGIWVVDADGTDAHEVVPQVEPGYFLESPDWSPDGTRISYLRSTGPGAATIHAVGPDGTGDVEISTSYGHTPRWAPDGRRLAFAELGLSVQTPGSDPERVYFLQPSEGILRGLSWAPDQSRFVLAQNSWTGSSWTHPVISTLDSDGSNRQELTQGWTPDWQPVPPVVPETVVTGAVPEWSLTQPVLRLTSDPVGGTFECSVDGGAWEACSSPYVPAWKVGDHRVAVRAVHDGNVDPTPRSVRWTAPYDDRQLTPQGDWTRLSGAGFYRESAVTTTTQGATLNRASVSAKRLALVASRCPTCGVVDVYYGDVRIKRVSLVAEAARDRAVIPIATWETRQPAATVRVVVVSTGKQVRIDGLGISGR